MLTNQKLIKMLKFGAVILPMLLTAGVSWAEGNLTVTGESKIGYQIVQATCPELPDQFDETPCKVECPAGTRILGGGAAMADSAFISGVNAGFPSSETTWSVRCLASSASGEYWVSCQKVYAICARVGF